MKRVRYLFLIFLVSISFNCVEVFAKPTTYSRDDDSHYRVPSDITITSSNKDNILSTPAVDESEKVYDFAELFTDDEEFDLYSDILSYKNITGFELVIVTVDDNAGKGYISYADDFYDYNYFDEDGIILLIDMDSRNYYMGTSGAAISAYTDSECYYIEDSLYDYMVDGDYYEAASRFIVLARQYYTYSSSGVSSNYTSARHIEWFKIIGFSLAGTIIVIVIMAYQNKMVKKANSSRSYLNNETKQIVAISDVFLGSNTTKVRIDTDSGGGSSHRSGGGSSSHRSSSGRSHGGGRGRGF